METKYTVTTIYRGENSTSSTFCSLENAKKYIEQARKIPHAHRIYLYEVGCKPNQWGKGVFTKSILVTVWNRADSGWHCVCDKTASGASPGKKNR